MTHMEAIVHKRTFGIGVVVVFALVIAALPGTLAAADPVGLTVSFTVPTQLGVTLDKSTLSFANVTPGTPSRQSNAVCANVVSNSTNLWALQVKPQQAMFEPSTGGVSTKALKWTPAGTNAWVDMDVTNFNNVKTGTTSDSVCLDLELQVPLTAKPTTYSGTIDFQVVNQ